VNFFAGQPEILNRLHDAVISTDLEGLVTDCNTAAEHIFGYSREEFIGQSVGILYPEDQAERQRQLIATVFEKGRADGEFLNRTKSGTEIWIHLSVSLLLTDQQVPYGMIGFSIDITEQRKAEQARRQAEALNRAARAAAGTGTWYWDLRSGRLAWDEQSYLLLDIPLEEEPSYDLFMSRVHPHDRGWLRRLHQDCIENGTEVLTEYRVVRRDGTLRWLCGTGRLYRDANNSAIQMLGVATDITARKHTELELQRSQAKYRVLFESPYIGVASGNLDRFTDVNDTYCQLTGYSREELLSGAVRWQNITPDEFLDLDYKCLQEMLTSGTGSPFEKEYIRKDGRRIRVLLGAALLSREPLEWNCFILDVTEQHRALAALRHTEKLSAAAKMGSSLAHEINNPLAALTNILYLLRNGAEHQSEYLLSSAQESLDRVNRISRQLIGLWSDSSRISDLKIDDIVADTVASYSGSAMGKNLTIEQRNDFSQGTFRSVEGDIRRLLTILVENAVEHSKPNGTVQVHVGSAQEWRGHRRKGLKIVVRDKGPGISHEKLASAFEPFFSTKPKRGSGLGLWVSRHIAEQHGGKVRIRSSVRPDGSGTCVSVFLPDKSGEPLEAVG
jgi:PAS domain S-box-containing protein